ncbi:unnamed protein product, partial [Didymodactylos carnosus]
METVQRYQVLSPSTTRLRRLPVLGLCCLGLLGLLFVGVIVIAVFSQKRDINGHQHESGIIQIIYNLPAFNESLMISGQVPQSRYEVLQNILQRQLNNATGGRRAQQIKIKVINVFVRQPQNIGKK